MGGLSTMSDERLLGELITEVRWIKEGVSELKSDVKDLKHWKLKVMGGASVISALIATLMHHWK
jgi:hypothetical protein